MTQTEDRILGLEDKVKNLGQKKKARNMKISKNHRKGID